MGASDEPGSGKGSGSNSDDGGDDPSTRDDRGGVGSGSGSGEHGDSGKGETEKETEKARQEQNLKDEARKKAEYEAILRQTKEDYQRRFEQFLFSVSAEVLSVWHPLRDNES